MAKRQRGRLTERREPTWDPLFEFAPDEVLDFMWMFELELADGSRAQAYKHRWTREYLYLDVFGRTYVRVGRVTYREVDPTGLRAEVAGARKHRANIVGRNVRLDGDKILWARSATRHRIACLGTRFVIEHVGICFVGEPGFRGEPSVYFFGDDADGRPLEVVGTEMADLNEKPFVTRTGLVITEDVAEELADEIESDEPVVFTGIRMVGRPSLDGNGASPRLSFRVPRDLYDAAAERAIKEERTVSAVAREALEKFLAG